MSWLFSPSITPNLLQRWFLFSTHQIDVLLLLLAPMSSQAFLLLFVISAPSQESAIALVQYAPVLVACQPCLLHFCLLENASLVVLTPVQLEKLQLKVSRYYLPEHVQIDSWYSMIRCQGVTETRFNCETIGRLLNERIAYLPVLACKLSESLLEHFFTLSGSEEGGHKTRCCNLPLSQIWAYRSNSAIHLSFSRWVPCSKSSRFLYSFSTAWMCSTGGRSVSCDLRSCICMES